ncbi:MAG: hypothetical protein ACTSW1_17630 [Candidatus Hodarchaeales archaeon]
MSLLNSMIYNNVLLSEGVFSSQDVKTERRVLIATNAWEHNSSTDFSILGIFFGLMVASVVLRSVRKA